MGDHQHSTTVRRDPDTVFAFLADPSTMPRYVEALERAEPTGGEDVHVVAEVEGHRFEGEAWMHADADAKNIRWGAGDSGAYFGELFVTGIGDVESRVTITLHTEHDDGPGVDEGLQRTLAIIRSELDESM
jgi:uncharacterized protein YndB with AHSA1/START domain